MAHYTVENTLGLKVEIKINGREVTHCYEAWTFGPFVVAKCSLRPKNRFVFGIGKVTVTPWNV